MDTRAWRGSRALHADHVVVRMYVRTQVTAQGRWDGDVPMCGKRVLQQEECRCRTMVETAGQTELGGLRLRLKLFASASRAAPLAGPDRYEHLAPMQLLPRHATSTPSKINPRPGTAQTEKEKKKKE